jgi:hypothetical protein
MIVIEELLAAPQRQYGAKPEMDPLTEPDALQEAQLLDVRLDALRLTVGLLFELRMALQLRETNTGVLIARGVRELTWSASPRTTDLTAWNLVGSTPICRNKLFRLTLPMLPVAQLMLTATHAEFYAGDVPGLDGAPPNYGDDDATIRSRVAGWHSHFSPVHAVFLDPAP